MRYSSTNNSQAIGIFLDGQIHYLTPAYIAEYPDGGEGLETDLSVKEYVEGPEPTKLDQSKDIVLFHLPHETVYALKNETLDCLFGMAFRMDNGDEEDAKRHWQEATEDKLFDLSFEEALDAVEMYGTCDLPELYEKYPEWDWK